MILGALDTSYLTITQAREERKRKLKEESLRPSLQEVPRPQEEEEHQGSETPEAKVPQDWS